MAKKNVPDRKGRDYWNRRALVDKARIINNAEDFLLKHQQKLYAQAGREIREEIEKLYQKFADRQKASLAEARRLVRGADFARIDWDGMVRQSLELRRQVREGKGNLPEGVIRNLEGQHKKLEDQLKALAKRGQVSYLELRQAEIDRKLLSLYDAQQMNIYDFLRSEYDDGYYRKIFEAQQMQGFGYDFVHPDDAAVETAILNQYQRKNYSATLYGHCEHFSRDLRENLVTGMIRGESLDKMARRIQGRMGVAYSDAKRLVRTETAYIYEQAAKDAYGQCGIEWYGYLATLDGATSEACREMDGKHFRLKDAMPGKNYPPMHPNCRSTTVCWFPDEKEKRKQAARLAKNGRGKYYEVPADMTYRQWQKKYGNGVQENIGKSIGILADELTDLKKPVKLSQIPYAEEIRKLVESSPSAAAKKVLKYYDRINFINLNPKYKDVFYHSDKKTGIRISLERAKNSPRGEFSSLWHEIGHCIDWMEGNRLYGKKFRDTLKKDVYDVLEALIQGGICGNMEEAYAYVDNAMKKDRMSYAAADIVKAVTGGRAGTGHDMEYWKRDRDNINAEAYAHFFEAQMKQDKSLDYIRQMFPDAYRMFEEALEDG